MHSTCCCLQCGTSFTILTSRLKRGDGKYCSRACSALGQRTRIACLCHYCGSTFFEKPARVHDGRGKYCSKNCHNLSMTYPEGSAEAYRHAYYQEHRATILQSRHAYYLGRHEELKAYAKAYYQTHKEQQLAYRRAKREVRTDAQRLAAAAYDRAYRLANPDKTRAAKARRRAAQRRSPLNDLTAPQWREITAAYGHRCVYCGVQPRQLEMDHITPLLHGGPHTASNVVPACGPCNNRKHTGPPPVPVQPLLLTLAPAKAG